MRKFLIAAVAAFAAIAFAAVSFAQTPAATMKVKVSPADAGTKQKPKNSKIRLQVENADTKRTMSELKITSPSTFKLSAKGLTKCNPDTLENSGPSACPKASRVGKGVAHALLGVNSAAPTPLTFDVTAVVVGAKNVNFHLANRENPALAPVAEGRISGRNLIIEVPAVAQQPLPNVWAGLVSLDATLSARKGKNYLASTIGCKNKKHNFSATLTFVNNGVSPAGDVTAKASSTCKK